MNPAMFPVNVGRAKNYIFHYDHPLFDYMVQKLETRVIIMILKSSPKEQLGNLEKENRVAKNQ